MLAKRSSAVPGKLLKLAIESSAVPALTPNSFIISAVAYLPGLPTSKSFKFVPVIFAVGFWSGKFLATDCK